MQYSHPGPLRTSATGIRLVQHDTKIAIEGNPALVTVVTTLASFLVVALAHRSLVAPLIPLASIGLATFLTLRVPGRSPSSGSLVYAEVLTRTPYSSHETPGWARSHRTRRRDGAAPKE